LIWAAARSNWASRSGVKRSSRFSLSVCRSCCYRLATSEIGVGCGLIMGAATRRTVFSSSSTSSFENEHKYTVRNSKKIRSTTGFLTTSCRNQLPILKVVGKK
jgi:hypothetical protein